MSTASGASRPSPPKASTTSCRNADEPSVEAFCASRSSPLEPSTSTSARATSRSRDRQRRLVDFGTGLRLEVPGATASATVDHARHRCRARKAGRIRHTARHPALAHRKISTPIDAASGWPTSCRSRRSCTCSGPSHRGQPHGRTRSGWASARRWPSRSVISNAYSVPPLVLDEVGRSRHGVGGSPAFTGIWSSWSISLCLPASTYSNSWGRRGPPPPAVPDRGASADRSSPADRFSSGENGGPATTVSACPERRCLRPSPR